MFSLSMSEIKLVLKKGQENKPKSKQTKQQQQQSTHTAITMIKRKKNNYLHQFNTGL